MKSEKECGEYQIAITELDFIEKTREGRVIILRRFRYSENVIPGEAIAGGNGK